MANNHTFGWLPDVPDGRDYLYTPVKVNIPDSVDLRSQMPAIYDQGNLGSCTANAVAAALDFQRARQAEHFITPSRLFIYYNERKDQHTIREDSGASIRESVKAVKHYGACPESEWKYDIEKFTHKPSKPCYTAALKYEDLLYIRVNQSLGDIQNALASGNAVVVGINVYESFESDAVANSGNVPMPNVSSEQLLGGHAVLVVGYENEKWIVRNSWGVDFGDRGYCYLPFPYLTNPKLSGDFWTLTKVR